MKHLILLIPIVLLLLHGVSISRAQSMSATPVYDVSWYTIDSGDATVGTGGAFSLGATIGQFDAGVMTGGRYTLDGGFTGDIAPAKHTRIVYLPVMISSPARHTPGLLHAVFNQQVFLPPVLR
jgi:hypothetical protein